MTEATIDDGLERHAQRVELTVLALCAVGLVMVYSAHAPYHVEARDGSVGDTFPALLSQAVKLGLGVVLLALGRFLDLDALRRHASKPFVLALVVLAIVPFAGVTLNGSRRWLALGPLSFQPIEFVKVALLVFLAARLATLGGRIRQLMPLGILLLVALAPPMLLLMLQPDFGSSVFLVGLALTIVMIAGARALHVGGICLAGFTALVGLALAFFPHVLDRFERHADLRPGDQVYQGLLALGSGGLAGYRGGLGDGIAKLGYVPMIQNDFILASIGEEAGLIGATIVVLLFALFTLSGAAIARAQQDSFRFLLAAGVVLLIAVQALINFAVVTKIGPTKGIALPFISSGGSALMFSMFAIGLLLNVARAHPTARNQIARYSKERSDGAPRRVRRTRTETDGEDRDPVVVARRKSGVTGTTANG
jgi:cell division protein FtsW